MTDEVCYEIKPGLNVEGVEWVCDNPVMARKELAWVRREFPATKFSVWRNDVEISDADLETEIESYEIAKVRDEQSQLPDTFRPGRGASTDDVAIGKNGEPVKVWGPENPEDRFES